MESPSDRMRSSPPPARFASSGAGGTPSKPPAASAPREERWPTLLHPADLNTIAARINERPRKVLGWASSHDVFTDSLNTISGALTG